MTFDMNKAWREAAEMVTANREVLLVVAGLFFFLPGMAFALFVPTPAPAPNLPPEAAMQLIMKFYADNAPWFIVMAIIQTVGILTLLALLRDHAKPTVGEALGRGLSGLLPYLASQILVAFAVAIVLSLAVAIASATGVGALMGVFLLVGLVAMVYIMIKISLVPAVIAVERQNNPIAILKRSWLLTKGNSGRLALFFGLLILVFGIVALVIGGILGILVALLGDGTPAQIGQAVVSGLIGTVATAFFVAILASVHRQLAGPSTETITQTFE